MLNKFSFVTVMLVGSMGIAVAQAPAPAPVKPATPAAKPATPAAKPAAKQAPAVKPVDAAKAPLPTPVAPPAMPTAPAELAAMAKLSAGTWKCTGMQPDMANPTATVKLTGTVKTKVDFDKWWMVDDMNMKAGKVPFRMMAYTTYDAKSAKWRRVAVDSMGGQMVGTSDGLKDNKLTFNMDTMGPMGSGMMRDYADMTNAKAPTFWGEMSMDKGKTWMKVYEMSCKK